MFKPDVDALAFLTSATRTNISSSSLSRPVKGSTLSLILQCIGGIIGYTANSPQGQPAENWELR